MPAVGARTLKVPPRGASGRVTRGACSGCGGRGTAARWAARGGAWVGAKSRRPLAPRCRGNQHILAPPLRQSHLAHCRSAPGWPCAACRGRVAVLRCLPRPAPPSRAGSVRLRHPCCGSVCRAAWDNTQPWCAEIASPGGCAPGEGVWLGSAPGCWLTGRDSVSELGRRVRSSRGGGKNPTGGWVGDPPAPSTWEGMSLTHVELGISLI